MLQLATHLWLANKHTLSILFFFSHFSHWMSNEWMSYFFFCEEFVCRSQVAAVSLQLCCAERSCKPKTNVFLCFRQFLCFRNWSGSILNWLCPEQRLQTQTCLPTPWVQPSWPPSRRHGPLSCLDPVGRLTGRPDPVLSCRQHWGVHLSQSPSSQGLADADFYIGDEVQSIAKPNPPNRKFIPGGFITHTTASHSSMVCCFRVLTLSWKLVQVLLLAVTNSSAKRVKIYSKNHDRVTGCTSFRIVSVENSSNSRSTTQDVDGCSSPPTLVSSMIRHMPGRRSSSRSLDALGNKKRIYKTFTFSYCAMFPSLLLTGKQYIRTALRAVWT